MSWTKRNGVVVYVVIDKMTAVWFKGKIKEKKQKKNLKECLVHVNLKTSSQFFALSYCKI